MADARPRPGRDPVGGWPRGRRRTPVDARRRGHRALPGVSSVGIGIPGLYDPAAGTTRFLVNIPGDWLGRPVAEPVARGPGPARPPDQRRACVRCRRAAPGRRPRRPIDRRPDAGHRGRRRDRRRRPRPARPRRHGRRGRPSDDRPRRPAVRLREPRLSRGVRPGRSHRRRLRHGHRRGRRRGRPRRRSASPGRTGRRRALPRDRHRQHDHGHLARSGDHRWRHRRRRRPPARADPRRSCGSASGPPPSTRSRS